MLASVSDSNALSCRNIASSSYSILTSFLSFLNEPNLVKLVILLILLFVIPPRLNELIFLIQAINFPF